MTGVIDQDNAGYTREQLAPIDVSEPAKQLPVASMPPWNGFGSLEDSAQSCLHLIPKQPVKDFYKLMQKDKIVLRFATCFVETPTHKLSTSDRCGHLKHCKMSTVLSPLVP